jgi:hypothetical protein
LNLWFLNFVRRGGFEFHSTRSGADGMIEVLKTSLDIDMITAIMRTIFAVEAIKISIKSAGRACIVKR